MLLSLSLQNSLPVLKTYRNKLFVGLEMLMWKTMTKNVEVQGWWIGKNFGNFRMQKLPNQDMRQKKFKAYWKILLVKIKTSFKMVTNIYKFNICNYACKIIEIAILLCMSGEVGLLHFTYILLCYVKNNMIKAKIIKLLFTRVGRLSTT